MASSEGEAYDEEGGGGGGGGGPSGNPTQKFVWPFFARNIIPPIQSEWPTSVSAPVAPDSLNNAMEVITLPDDAVKGYSVEFNVPSGVTLCDIFFMSRGTGTAGAWVPLARGRAMGPSAAPDVFAALKVLAAQTMPAGTGWVQNTQIDIPIADLGAVAGEPGQIEFTRDKVGQGGDTIATPIFEYLTVLVFH